MPLLEKNILPKLCPDFALESHGDAPIPFIVTPMFYPNGDSINLYFRVKGKQVFASDEGTTLDAISGGTIGFSDERRKIAGMICQRTNTNFVGSTISKSIRSRFVSEDCIVLCQAISMISGLYFQQDQNQRSKLSSEIETILEKRVKPKRAYVKHWKDSKIDPAGAFSVDFHFNGELPARNLFYVTTSGKALLVTAVVHFLRSHKIKVPTLSVVDNDADIKGKQIDRLRFASDDIIFGIKGHQKNIVNFALGKSSSRELKS